MGTRGLFGFYYKGRFYVVYNHWDSYPRGGLGSDLVKEIKNAINDNTFGQWLSKLIKIKVVDGSMVPSEEDINSLSGYTDIDVSLQSTKDWYCLLRGCQGSFTKTLESGYLLNHITKKGEPMFEDYAYIINFDTNQFDYYVGNYKRESYEFSKLPVWD